MRNLLPLIILTLLLAACGGSSKKTSFGKYLDVIETTGKDSLQELRGIDIDLHSDIVFENASETWANIIVNYENTFEEYVIILGREGYMYSEYDIDIHEVLQSMLDIDFVLFQGKMRPVPDVSYEGAADYLISTESPVQKGKIKERLIIIGEYSSVLKRFETDNKVDADLKIKINEHIVIDTLSGEQPVIVVKGSQEHMTKPGILFAHYGMSYLWNPETGYIDYQFVCRDELRDGNPDLAGLYQVDDEYIEYLKNRYDMEYEYDYEYKKSFFDWLNEARLRLQKCKGRPNEWDYSVLLDLISEEPVLNPSYTVQRTDIMDRDFFESFNNINPDFINWASEKMVPDPDQKELNGFFYQYLYDRLFQFGTRTMAAVYLYLNDKGFDAQMENYAYAASGDQYDTYGDLNTYLETTYEDFSLGDYGMDDEEPAYGYYRQHLSFWLRRGLDGSHVALLNGLKKILELYDPVWLDQFNIAAVEGDLVSEEEYNMAKNNRIAGSLLTDHHRFSMVRIDASGITISCDNGEQVFFEENNSDDERMANYSVIGYLEPHDMAVIRYSGWEWGDYKCVRLSDAHQVEFNDPSFSPGGNFVFQLDSNMEYDRISMSYFNGRKLRELWSSDEYWEGVFWYSDTELYARKPFTNGAEYYKLYIVK